MAQQLVRGGGMLDIPTADETAAAVDGRTRAWWAEQTAIQQARERELARTKKRMELLIPVAVPAVTFFTGVLVESGYAWALKMVAVNLAANSTLAVYKASVSGDTRRPLANLVANSTSPLIATWSSDQAGLREGEGLYLVSGQNITGVYVVAWEAAAEMESRLYD